MSEKMLLTKVEALREYIQSKGWSISAEKEIAHGYQLVVTDGTNKTAIYLLKSGKVLIQGKPSILQSELRSWGDERRVSSEGTNTAGMARIGSDESGKGDYFGPLVVGAVYVDDQTEARLIDLGVCDSKLLPDHRIIEMAEVIGQMCPYSVVSLGPKTYNEMYAQMQNLNQLLAWGHARCLEKVLGEVICDLTIADQFGNKCYLLKELGVQCRQISLEHHPHAESDMAVAAASILARAEFVRKMEQLSRQVGKRVPKGGLDPSINTI